MRSLSDVILRPNSRVFAALVTSGFLLLTLGCVATQPKGVLDRMSKERPRWLKKPQSVCPVAHRCALAEGRGQDLSDATSAAKAKAISTLISEVAVEITGQLEIYDDTRGHGEMSRERTRITQRIAARVRGNLTNARTLSNYWEKGLKHSSTGSRIEYQSFLVVGVPVSTLDDMRTAAQTDKQTLEREVARYRTYFYDEGIHSLGDGFSPELAKLRAFKSRVKSLVIASPVVEETIQDIETEIAGRTKLVLLKQEVEDGRALKVLAKMSVGGETPEHVPYQVSVEKGFECEVQTPRVTVLPGGLFELVLTPSSQLATGSVIVHPVGFPSIKTDLYVPPIAATLPLVVKTNYSGYSRRYIGATVGGQIQATVVESSPLLSAERVSDQPYLLLEFDVALASKPSRVTSKLIQIRADVQGSLLYVGQVRRQIGRSTKVKIAGMGSDERSAAASVAAEIVRAGTKMSKVLLGGR